MSKESCLNFSITRKTVFTVLIILWIVFSVFYVLHDLWKGGVQMAYRLGYEKAFVEVMERTSAACEPIKLYAGQGSVDVINVACLQQKNPVAEADEKGEVEAEK